MAIKIDLLPGYVGLRRILKWSLVISLVIVTSVGSVLYILYFQKTLEVKTANANVQTWQPISDEAKRVKSETDTITAGFANTQATVTFFATAAQTGPRRAIVVDMLKNYIMGDAQISSIDISDGKTVDIVASVANADDYGRLLLNMRKGATGASQSQYPYVFANQATGSGIAGFPSPSLPKDFVPFNPAGELIPKPLPVTVAIRTALRDEFIMSTPTPPGDTAPATPGQGGQPAGGSSSPGSSTTN